MGECSMGSIFVRASTQCTSRFEALETEGFAFGLNGLRRLKGGSIESVPVTYRNRDFVERFAGFALDQIAKKEKKPYPEDTTLIVQCTLNLPYLSDEWDDLLKRIAQALPPSRFREIYIYDPLGRYSHTFYPK